MPEPASTTVWLPAARSEGRLARSENVPSEPAVNAFNRRGVDMITSSAEPEFGRPAPATLMTPPGPISSTPVADRFAAAFDAFTPASNNADEGVVSNKTSSTGTSTALPPASWARPRSTAPVVVLDTVTFDVAPCGRLAWKAVKSAAPAA
ncbi:unannotated protein [freshwater metagenome]|uniref:Unannotated protein n=1 Tax=freshwater metagenome TaxID=449393 RepID=A0A6J6EPN8_9ZZZZ